MSWRLVIENVIVSLGIRPASKYPKCQAANDAKKSPANFTGSAKVKNKQKQKQRHKYIFIATHKILYFLWHCYTKWLFYFWYIVLTAAFRDEVIEYLLHSGFWQPILFLKLDLQAENSPQDSLQSTPIKPQSNMKLSLILEGFWLWKVPDTTHDYADNTQLLLIFCDRRTLQEWFKMLTIQGTPSIHPFDMLAKNNWRPK